MMDSSYRRVEMDEDLIPETDSIQKYLKSDIRNEICILLSDNARIKCSKVLLGANSPVFAAMFNSKFAEGSKNVIPLTDTQPSLMRLFLRLLHRTDNLGSPLATLLDLLDLCDRFQALEAQKRVCKQIVTMINRYNVMDIWLRPSGVPQKDSGIRQKCELL